MIDLGEFTKIKTRVDKIQRDVSRAEGALSETASQVKKEFGCASLGEAEVLAKKFNEDATKAEERYQRAVEAFWEEWKDKIDD